MFSVHLLDSWLHCQLHCSAAAFSLQESRPTTDQTNRVGQYHVYTVPSWSVPCLYCAQWAAWPLTAAELLWLPVTECKYHSRTGLYRYFFLFSVQRSGKSNTKGMAWMKSLRKETQISKGSLLLAPELLQVWQLLFEVAAESCFYLHLVSLPAHLITCTATCCRDWWEVRHT